MHLLKLIGPNEYSLVQVPTHNDLPYAILSHTWTPGQEVTYQELMSGSGKNKTGFEKIKFCGEQATKDGFLYFWVDTCCIDKLNPTELATAINSMFRWYRNAKKCYVYLADVSTPRDEADQSTWEAAFRKSRWFTRGWTLQELIAPAIVEFYSKEGKQLGNKKSLEAFIHEITKIPLKALQGNPFSDFSIAEREGWAVQRQTTEQEDMVYCLIGLCEVSMPLLYGEGKEAAQKRLETAIKEFSQASELKIREDTKVPFIVPFNRNSNFTGRKTQLAEIEKRLFAVGQSTKCAVWGLGGVGKTQLVLELVYRTREKYKNCLVIWIPATNKESLHQAYLKVAQKLGIAKLEEDKTDVKLLVQEHLSKESTGPWLLVFDNADDMDMWTGKSDSEQESSRLINCLPQSEHGCIVFTTRDRKIAVKLAQKNVVEVPKMDEDIAINLLQRLLIELDLASNISDVKAVLNELTYLPLAIVQAAAYINENGISLADYLSLLTDQEEGVIDLLSEEFEDDWRYRTTKNPIAMTWLISFEQIQQRDPLAADYLSFIACIDPKDVPQSLLPPGISRKKELDAIGTLNAYSFINKRSVDQSLDLHRLVHLSTRNWLRKEDLLADTTEKVIRRLEEVFPDEDHNNRILWRKYLPHARYVLESNLVDKALQSRMNLTWRYGLCLSEDGRWKEAEAAIAEILEIERRDLGEDDLSILASMSWLAITYMYQGRWDEAEALQVEVMEACKVKLGADHPDTLISMSNLASTYRNQGRWDKAEVLQMEVIETRKMKLGADHPDTLISMNNLASTYRNQGRWDEAEVLQMEVMEAYKVKLGADHPDTLISMSNLASTYMNQGRWDEAEVLQMEVMKARKVKLGADHPDTLISMSNLASTYRNQGRWGKAEVLQMEVMETRKMKLGADHPDTLISMNNLASTYMNQGRWDEAEVLQMEVMEACKVKLGADHPDTLTSMSNLASTYWNQGRWDEAEVLQMEVIETRKMKLGADHPDTLTSMSNLASTYWNQGRWDEAEALHVEVMEARKMKLGADHPNTLTSMNNLAITWKGLGRDEDALKLMQDCLTLQNRRKGVNHPDTLSSRETLLAWQTEELEISTSSNENSDV